MEVPSTVPSYRSPLPAPTVESRSPVDCHRGSIAVQGSSRRGPYGTFTLARRSRTRSASRKPTGVGAMGSEQGPGNRGGDRRKQGGFLDGLRSFGAAVLEGFVGAAQPASGRRDPVATNERPAAARQIHRSLNAWRDRSEEDPSAEAHDDNQSDAESSPSVATKLKGVHLKVFRAGADDAADPTLPAYASTGQNKRSFKKLPPSIQALLRSNTLGEADFLAIKALDDGARAAVATLLGRGTVVVELFKRMDPAGKTALASAADLDQLITDATDARRPMRRERIANMRTAQDLLDWRVKLADRPRNLLGPIETTRNYTELVAEGFRPAGQPQAQGRTNPGLERNLEEEEPGGWNKYYWDFQRGGAFRSLHYNQNETTRRTFDIGVRNGASNPRGR